MKEAGYPDGFNTTLYAFRQPPSGKTRWPATCAQIGIQAKIQLLQYPAFRNKNHDGVTPISFGDWGSYSINDASAILGNFFRGSADDFSGDKELQGWVKEGDTNTDKEKRLAAYKKAISRIMDQMYVLPMNSYSIYYAYTSDLNFRSYQGRNSALLPLQLEMTALRGSARLRPKRGIRYSSSRLPGGADRLDHQLRAAASVRRPCPVAGGALGHGGRRRASAQGLWARPADRRAIRGLDRARRCAAISANPSFSRCRSCRAHCRPAAGHADAGHLRARFRARAVAAARRRWRLSSPIPGSIASRWRLSVFGPGAAELLVRAAS